MRNRKTLLSVLVLAAMMLTLAGCGGKDAETEEPEETAGTAVQVQTVSRETISTENTVSGTVASDDERTIFLGSSVKCTAVYAEAGDSVEADDIICTLDMASILSSYEAASISYSSAAQSYQDNSAVFADQIALYQKNVNDLKALYEIGAASQIEIDQAELQLKTPSPPGTPPCPSWRPGCRATSPPWSS